MKRAPEELSVAEGILQGLQEAVAIKKGLLKPGKITQVAIPDVKGMRKKMGFTQEIFAKIIGVPRDTIRNWEQKKNNPTGAAMTLLKLIEKRPDVIHVLTA